MSRLAGRRATVTPGTVALAIAPALWAGATHRLIVLLRGSDTPASRDLGVALASVAVAGATLPPAALEVIESLTGDANYGRFLSQVGTVVAAGYGQSMALRLTYSDERAKTAIGGRRRHMLGTLTVMTAILSGNRATAGELQQPSSLLFRPIPASYWLTFSGFMIRSTREIAHLARQLSQMSEAPPLRAGLRLLGAGSTAITAFYGQYALGVVAHMLKMRFPLPVRGLPAQVIMGGAAATISLGASLPLWSLQLRQLRQKLADAVVCARLGLWREIRRFDPQGVLPATDAKVRLYRRVIETLEGLDELGQYPGCQAVTDHAETVGKKHGLDEMERSALAEAALVAYVNRIASHGVGAAQLPAQPTVTTARAPDAPADYRQEATRLVKASRLYRRSRLPKLIAQHVEEHIMSAHQPPTSNAEPGKEVDAPGCTCLPEDPDTIGYLEYAVGRAAARAALAEERDHCPAHGAGAPQLDS